MIFGDEFGDVLLGVAAVVTALGGFLWNWAQTRKQMLELKKALSEQASGIKEVNKELKPNSGSTTRDDLNWVKDTLQNMSADMRGIRRDIGRLQDADSELRREVNEQSNLKHMLKEFLRKGHDG